MKRVLLTGVNGGVGRLLAESLCQKGWLVYGICRSLDSRSESLLKQASKEGWQLELKACDFTNSEALEELRPWLKKLASDLDAFVHLAAPRLNLDPLWRETVSSLDRHWQVGARAAFQIVSSIIRSMSKKEKSQFVFVLSEVTLGTPPKGMSGYTIGKYALLGLAQSISAEYAPHVAVTCLSPSIMDTELLSDLPETAKQFLVRATQSQSFLLVKSLIQEIVKILENSDPGSSLVNKSILGASEKL